MTEQQAEAILAARGWSEDDVAALIRDGYDDHAAFCRRMKIRNKQGDPVPVELFPGQRKLSEAIKAQERKGIPVRIIFLKGRQEMISAGAATEVFRRVAFMPGQHALIYAHIHSSAKEIWSYYDQFSRTYQPGQLGIRQLKVERRVQDEGIYWEQGSSIEVRSAENTKSGRSASIRILHLSEGAFWRDAVTLRTGLFQSVPKTPGTIIIDESTANGQGGPYYENWKRYSDPYGTSDWLAIFLGYWEHPEYQMAVEDPYRFERSLTDEEQREREKYVLSLKQLRWRRWVITNECDGDVRRFRQEYPGCPEEAFQSSGYCRFDTDQLAKMRIIRNSIQGTLEEVDDGPGARRLEFVEKERAELIVYQKPVRGKGYVIGIDQAEGIDVNRGRGGSDDPDFSVAHVADRETGEQVAMLRLRMEPAPFARYCARLGRWYNWAYLVPEASPIGVAFIGELLQTAYPLQLLYSTKRDPNDRRPALIQEIGWRATETSKQQLISAHDQAIRAGEVHLHDTISVQEHLSFVTKPNGKVEGNNCHDDTVIGAALATIGLRFAPLPQRMMPKPRIYDPDDDDRPRGGAVQYGRRR